MGRSLVGGKNKLLRLIALNKFLLNIIVVRGYRREKEGEKAAGSEPPHENTGTAQAHGMGGFPSRRNRALTAVGYRSHKSCPNTVPAWVRYETRPNNRSPPGCCIPNGGSCSSERRSRKFSSRRMRESRGIKKPQYRGGVKDALARSVQWRKDERFGAMSHPPYRALVILLGFLSFLMAIGGVVLIVSSKPLILRLFLHPPEAEISTLLLAALKEMGGLALMLAIMVFFAARDPVRNVAIIAALAGLKSVGAFARDFDSIF
jgi:hypothetical protein